MYIVANWKLNPASLSDAKTLLSGTKEVAKKAKGVTAIVCPPSLFISPLRELYRKSTTFFIGAQNMYAEDTGAFTGEISIPMLKSVSVNHVIIGHSERRGMGETDEDVAKKVSRAVNAGFTVILCIGEWERDEQGSYLGVVEQQIKTALSKVTYTGLSQVLLAYEPVWAIGKGSGSALDAHGVHQMVLYIRKVLKDMYKKNSVLSTPVLYGGSVDAENAEALMREGEVSGLLVGGKSLSVKSFGDILLAASKVTTS